MRNSQRIKEVTSLIEKIWERDPDLRYLQLLYILQSGFSKKHNDAGKIQATEDDGLTKVGYDLFNIGDDAFNRLSKRCC